MQPNVQVASASVTVQELVQLLRYASNSLGEMATASQDVTDRSLFRTIAGEIEEMTNRLAPSGGSGVSTDSSGVNSHLSSGDSSRPAGVFVPSGKLPRVPLLPTTVNPIYQYNFYVFFFKF